MKIPNVPLGKLADQKGDLVDGPFGSNLKASEYVDSGVPIIRLQNIKPNRYVPKDIKFITQQKAEEIKRHNYKAGDVVIAKLGDVGTACVVPEGCEDGIIVADVVRFRGDKTKVNYKYLCGFLNSPEGQRRVLRYSKGTTRLRTNLTDLKKVEIPLPLLNDQIRIAHLLSKVERLIAQRKESLQKLDDLMKSVFLDMFGDPVRNEKGWEKKPLAQLGNLDRGVSKHRPRNAPELLGGRYPLIQTGDVSNAGTYITSFNQTYSETGFAQSKSWPSGTLCITIAANIAQTGILTFDACFPDSVVGFSSHKNTSTPLYVLGLFWFFQRILEKNAPAAAQKNINLKILRELEVPVPPIDLQNQFATIVEKVEGLKSRYQQTLTDLESFYGSLSEKAFKGVLDLSRIVVEHHAEEVGEVCNQ